MDLVVLVTVVSIVLVGVAIGLGLQTLLFKFAAGHLHVEVTWAWSLATVVVAGLGQTLVAVLIEAAVWVNGTPMPGLTNAVSTTIGYFVWTGIVALMVDVDIGTAFRISLIMYIASLAIVCLLMWPIVAMIAQSVPVDSGAFQAPPVDTF
jgi:hypothetical protein